MDPTKAATDLLDSVGQEFDGNVMLFLDVYTYLVLLFYAGQSHHISKQWESYIRQFLIIITICKAIPNLGRQKYVQT